MAIFFFKQKTAYEIGTGDWSSDVCSSDLNTLVEFLSIRDKRQRTALHIAAEAGSFDLMLW